MISHKTENIAGKEELMLSLGGKIFDILISVLGILQAGKVLKSTARIVKSYKSILSVVDDVAAVISKIASEIFK